MNRLSVMTLGFLRETFLPYRIDGNISGLRERYMDLFADIKSAGINAIDISQFEADTLGIEFVMQAVADFGFTVASFIVMGNYANSQITVEQNVETVKNAVITAKKLNAKTFMLVPSSHEGIESMAENDVTTNIVTNVKALLEYVSSQGLTVIVEDYSEPTLHLSSAKELDNLLSVAKDAKLVYDSANMIVAGEDSVEFARHFKGRIAHVHLKDIEITNDKSGIGGERLQDGRKIRTVFIGTGAIDIPSVIKALIADGYNGYFALEFGDIASRTRKQALTEAKLYVEEAINAKD